MALMFAVAVVFALVDVLWWSLGSPETLATLWVLAPYAVLVSGVEYLGVTAIVRSERSAVGYVRFAFTSVLVILPLLLVVGLLLTAPVVGKGPALTLFFVGVPIAFVLSAFLPAWPVAQSLSQRLVFPTTILRATHGFRWGLIGMAMVLAAFNRADLVPPVKDASDVGRAFAYAAGEAGISALSMIYTAAVAGTAFLFAVRNDEGLLPPQSPPSGMGTSAPVLPGAERSVGRVAEDDSKSDGTPSAERMVLRAGAFWIAVLFGLVALSLLVPGFNSLPHSAVAAAIVAIIIGWSLLAKRRQRRT